jgi:hypothetical protein
LISHEILPYLKTVALNYRRYKKKMNLSVKAKDDSKNDSHLAERLKFKRSNAISVQVLWGEDGESSHHRIYNY